MNKFKPCTLLLCVFIQSCILYMPAPAKDTIDYGDCEVITKKLMLKQSVYAELSDCNTDECVMLMVAIGAASAIVSGSIVLANNTLRWAEYVGKCGGNGGNNPELSQ